MWQQLKTFFFIKKVTNTCKWPETDGCAINSHFVVGYCMSFIYKTLALCITKRDIKIQSQPKN